jgi:hypothetical protein
MESLVEKLPLLRKITMSISCGLVKCALALQSSHDAIWPNVPEIVQAALLAPAYTNEFYGDERLIEYVKEMREGDYGDLPAHRPVDFFKRRVTMARWTLSHGWQADAKVTKKARKYKARLTREVPAWC